jgi:hypothetical protein
MPCYAGCVGCRFHGPARGPAGCAHPEASRPGFFDQEGTEDCWTAKDVESETRPGGTGPNRDYSMAQKGSFPLTRALF